jgi:membrane-associated phospholipid phosphatase
MLVIPGVLSASWLLSPELAPPHCAPECDPDTVNAIDRPAAGLYSTGWSTAGSVATVAVLASMPLFLGIAEPPLDALNDLVVVLQATLFASATQVITSFATSRPRPRVYGSSAPLDERDDGNAARSFFSGHMATCTAATVSTFLTLQRVGRTELAWTALAFGATGSGLLGVARVGAGSHFPTDVAAGAAVGVAYGFLLPALHARPAREEAGARKRVLLVPMSGDGLRGAGLVGSF